MLWASIFFALAGLISLSTAGYVLQDDYSPQNFFSMFDFFTDDDPTHGYVDYVDQSTAQRSGLVNTNNGAVYMGVDSSNVVSGGSRGRQSVRITSKKAYNKGLIILDLSHMPGGICGTWPAFWTVGPNWPNAGEIDIIEGVNSQSANSMALHTNPGCSISNNALFSGSITTPNCDVNAHGQAMNAGCQIVTSNRASYGAGFNQGQGGVFATEWTGSHISIWFFPRGSIPSDISSGSPDPSNWGTPEAAFVGGCDIDQYFKSQQIVFDTTFCGDWAGNVWNSDPVCSSKASTCQSFVQNNPSAFANAYWTVNSLKVYQSPGGGSNPVPGGGASASAGIPGGHGVPTAGVPPPVPVPVPSAGYPGGAPAPAPSPAASYVPEGGQHRGGGGNGGNGRYTRTYGGAANFAAVPSSVEVDAVAVVPTDPPKAVVAVQSISDAPKDVSPTPAPGAAFFVSSDAAVAAAAPTVAVAPAAPSVNVAEAPAQPIAPEAPSAPSAPAPEITVVAVVDTASPPPTNKKDCLTVTALGSENFDHQGRKREPEPAMFKPRLLEVSALKRDAAAAPVPDKIEEKRSAFAAAAAAMPSGFREIIVKRGPPLLKFPEPRDLESVAARAPGPDQQHEEDIIEKRNAPFFGPPGAAPLVNFADKVAPAPASAPTATPPKRRGQVVDLYDHDDVEGDDEDEEDDDVNAPLVEEIREIKRRSGETHQHQHRHQHQNRHLRFHRHLVKHGVVGR